MTQTKALSILAAAILALPASAAERVSNPADFNYLETDSIYLVIDDRAVAYGRFPRFFDLKGILLSSLDRSPQTEVSGATEDYTLYVVAGNEYTVVEVNGRTLSDGNTVGQMSVDAYDEFQEIVDERLDSAMDRATAMEILEHN
jgi:hypothetical protein